MTKKAPETFDLTPDEEVRKVPTQRAHNHITELWTQVLTSRLADGLSFEDAVHDADRALDEIRRRFVDVKSYLELFPG